MSGGPPQPARLTPRQALGWGVALLVIIVLVILFFRYGRQVRPVLGMLPLEAWPTRSS